MALLLLGIALRVAGIGWGLPGVYEEATPLHQGWEMWGWGPDQSFDPNPHFFNYPTLTIYLHFLVTGALYPVLQSIGLVTSPVDYAGLFVANKAPFILLARSITIAFAAATIWVLFRARTIPGPAIAAFLLAVNPLHISRSQMVEVDVPLTFLVALGLHLAVRLVSQPTLRNYAYAGLVLGLAASTKYTGAVLLLPLLTAHILARGAGREPSIPPPAWQLPVLGLATAAAAFLATSPFVVIDFSTAMGDLSLEARHMEVGHFGRGAASTLVLYLRSLTREMLGVPLALLVVAGMIRQAGVQRRPWAIVLSAFVVSYFLAIVSWKMHADRYLLPLLGPTLLLAAATLAEIVSRLPFAATPSRRVLATAAATVLVLAPLGGAYAGLGDRLRPHPLLEATAWMEEHAPRGSFIVTEYGPSFLGAPELWMLQPEVRQRVKERRRSAGAFAVQRIPMFQTRPERSAVFYDLSLYEHADFIMTVGGVRSRYEKDRERFPSQNAFYDSLDARYENVGEFGDPRRRVTIYRDPRRSEVFARRDRVQSPPELQLEDSGASGSEADFYYVLAVNYQTFGHLAAALEAYGQVFRHSRGEPDMHLRAAAGATWCLLRHDPGRVDEFLRIAASEAPNGAVRERLLAMRRVMARDRSGVPKE